MRKSLVALLGAATLAAGISISYFAFRPTSRKIKLETEMTKGIEEAGKIRRECFEEKFVKYPNSEEIAYFYWYKLKNGDVWEESSIIGIIRNSVDPSSNYFNIILEMIEEKRGNFPSELIEEWIYKTKKAKATSNYYITKGVPSR